MAGEYVRSEPCSLHMLELTIEVTLAANKWRNEEQCRKQCLRVNEYTLVLDRYKLSSVLARWLS